MTVVPASRTGERTAFGVRTPVRPTWTTMSSTTDSFSSGGYLKAMAQRGTLEVEPRISRSDKLLSFTTAPSMSKGSSARSRPMRRISSRASSSSVTTRFGITGKPWQRR